MPRVKPKITNRPRPVTTLRPPFRLQLSGKSEAECLELSPSQWIQVCRLAQPPLSPVQECVPITIPARCDSSIGPTPDVKQITSACHDLSQRQQMADTSTVLKTSWSDIHKGAPMQDVRVNRTRMEEIDKENFAELRRLKMKRALQIVQHAEKLGFRQRDEIKTLDRCLMEVEAIKGQQEQTDLAMIIHAKRAAHERESFRKLVERDELQYQHEKEKQMEEKKKARDFWLDVVKHERRHDPPLRHDFDYLRQQRQHIYEHNRELAEEAQEERRSKTVNERQKPAMLDAQIEETAIARTWQRESDKQNVLRDRLYMKNLMDRIQKVKNYQQNQQRDKEDIVAPAVQAAIVRGQTAAALERDWDDKCAEHFRAYLEKWDRTQDEKRLRREMELKNVLNIRDEQRLAKKLNEMAVKKNKVAERLGVEEDVENFWKEMRAKEEKKRLIKSSMGKSWEGQMREKAQTDRKYHQERADHHRVFQEKLMREKSDFTSYAKQTISERQMDHVQPLIRGMRQINDSTFRYLP